ncbi:MAG: protein translocase subunit SecF [Actinomycetota bacterium]
MSKMREFGNQLYSGEKSFDFIGRRKIWYIVAAFAVILAIVLPILRGGFNFGIEFRGGSEFRLTNSQGLSQNVAVDAVQSVVPLAQVSVTNVGVSDLRIQTQQLEDVESEAVRLALAEAFSIDSALVASSFIGPNWGAEITRQALIGLAVFLLIVSILMAFYFRSWKMSAAALVALAHDLVFTLGVYAGVGFEVTPAAVIGFLTILAYSLYDTVVVFDKVRENTLDIELSETRTFGEAVNLAVNQTLVRSINTSVVSVLPVAAILFIGSVLLGAGTLRDISLALFVGTIVGTYSSIFLAAPVYVHLREREPALKAAAERVMAARQ